MKILGIAGSLRQNSYNRIALRAAQALLPEGVTLEVFDLAGIPLFNEELEANPPQRVVAFRAAIQAADAILFATPEYNYSIPGVLKNAIDWGSRPYGKSAWEGKPAATIGATPGAMGTSRAQHELRQLLVFLNMHTANRPEVLIGAAYKAFDAEGKLVDETAAKLLKELLANLVAWTRQLQKGAAA